MCDGHGDQLLGLLRQGARAEHRPAESFEGVVDLACELLAPPADIRGTWRVNRLIAPVGLCHRFPSPRFCDRCLREPRPAIALRSLEGTIATNASHGHGGGLVPWH